MNDLSVAFIGGGNMTSAIVMGLLGDGWASTDITIAEPLAEQRERLREEMPGVVITADNDEAVSRASNVVLAVKPQVLPGVCRALAGAVKESGPMLISIAAGTRIADIDAWLGGGNAIARIMPNQPALLQKGVSGLFANATTTAAQHEAARRIMSAVGPVIDVERESDIDAVTAVSGSGPAYFYLLIEMIENAAVDFGLGEDAARQLAIGTAIGAAALADASDDKMSELIARVRSPGGTTAAALDSLENDGVRDIFSRAIRAARDRATELADLAGTDASN